MASSAATGSGQGEGSIVLARTAGWPRVLTAALRCAVALLVVLAALRLAFPPVPLGRGAVLLLWPLCACGIGLVIARRPALLLAPLPLAGERYTVLTGPEYLTVSESYGFFAVTFAGLLIAEGLAGIGLGVALARRALPTLARRLGVAPRAADVPLLLVIGALVLGGAALDRARGGSFAGPPEPIAARRVGEAEVRAAIVGLDFAVYAAPPEEGPATAVLRQPLAPPGIPPLETVMLIYCDDRCRRVSEVQVVSAPAAYARVVAPRLVGGTPIVQGGRVVPTPVTTPREVAGVVWQVAEGGPVRGAIEAGAIIGDTYVTIRAPGDAPFARVAAGLRRIAP